MVVSKSKAMIVLLDALRIKPWEYEILNDKILIKLNGQQIVYAINGSSEAVQHIYGKTKEWEEITANFKGMV